MNYLIDWVVVGVGWSGGSRKLNRLMLQRQIQMLVERFFLN